MPYLEAVVKRKLSFPLLNTLFSLALFRIKAVQFSDIQFVDFYLNRIQLISSKRLALWEQQIDLFVLFLLKCSITCVSLSPAIYLVHALLVITKDHNLPCTQSQKLTQLYYVQLLLLVLSLLAFQFISGGFRYFCYTPLSTSVIPHFFLLLINQHLLLQLMTQPPPSFLQVQIMTIPLILKSIFLQALLLTSSFFRQVSTVYFGQQSDCIIDHSKLIVDLFML